ncbi:MAG: urease accessory protein UreD [Oscillatoria sp. SIO1A7]|nr:urease accessory protein UreD [Oscillatoria sp. SIO1A7]
MPNSQFPIPNSQQTWHGSLNLRYADRQGSTQLIRDRSVAPLRVQRPFYPEGREVCHSVVLHTAGGMVGGDRLCQEICLEPNARALITTAAAAKIYRSNGLLARQTIRIAVDSGACLEWFPQETILFDGAQYQQDLRVELAPGALWLGWEILRFGRSARGERFLGGTWRSNAEIWQNGRPLWIDRQQLAGGPEAIDSAYSLAGAPVVASLAWVGQPVSAELVRQVRELWSRQENIAESDSIGATRLMSGLLCRYRGYSSTAARRWFMDIWQLLRLSFLGRPSCPPRVWPL